MFKIVYLPLLGLDTGDIKRIIAQRGCEAPINVVNWKEYGYAPEVRGLLAHDGHALWCLFQVKEKHVRAHAMEQNGPVWEDSCVELFVAHPDGKRYFNFETNAAGTPLAALRESRTECRHFSPEEMARLTHCASLPHEVADLRSADGVEWNLLVGIPFSSLGYEEGAQPRKLRINLYKCGDATDTPHFLSWNPVDAPTPDFHRPENFAEVELDGVY